MFYVILAKMDMTLRKNSLEKIKNGNTESHHKLLFISTFPYHAIRVILINNGLEIFVSKISGLVSKFVEFP